MNDMNSALIEGTVVASPAVKAKSTVSGSSLVMFRIASNRYYRDRKNEEVKSLADTHYLDIACWGSLGDFCMESICKGQTVRVVGRIKNSTYKSPDGSREYSRFSILAQHITFRQRKQNGEGEKEEEITKREDAMLEKADKVEKVLQQAAKVLAANTNYATMVSAPVNSRNTLKFIQLSQVDEEQIVAVIVLGGNVIKNKIIEVGETLSNETLLKLNMLLNTTLNGMPIDQITLGLIARLKEQAGIHSEVVGHVLDAVAEIIHVEDDMKIYTSGATNIFKYPELSDKQSAQEIISAFEEKQQLEDLVTETLASENNHGIQVYIGDEAPVKTMKDCSVVTATYELGEGMKGTIGIIGPKRMDYEHVMKTLKTLQGELDAIYNKNPKE